MAGYNGKHIKTISTATGKTNPFKDDVIVDPEGQWKYPGQVTKIPSGDITMKGVNYPVLGVDNLGNKQMMYPGMDYSFPGQSVTEYPQVKKGGWLDNYAGGGSPSPDKARAMLEDGTAHGHPLTQRQIDFFKTLIKEDDEDADVEEYRRGGTKKLKALNRNKTSRNIKSSINFINARNFDIYGLPGTRFYDPNSKFETGGWLDQYQNGGLRAAGTSATTPVSTQAPIVPTNKIGWDWAAERYENRQPSNWNFMMPDKYGEYVDSGVSPFDAILSAPQQVVRTVSEAAKALKGLPKGANTKAIDPIGKMERVGTSKDLEEMARTERYGLKVGPEFERYQRKLDTDLMEYNQQAGTNLFVKNPFPTKADKLTGQVGIPEYSEELMRFGTRPMVKSIGTKKEYDKYLEKIAEWKKKTGQSEDGVFDFFKKSADEGDPEMMKIFPKPEPKQFYLKDDDGIIAANVARIASREKEVPEAIKYFNNPGDERIVQWMKTGDPKDVIREMAPNKYKNLDKMTPQQLEKARQEVHNDFINRWKKGFKESISTPYTGSQAFQQLSPNKYGGEQKGWLDKYK